MINEEDYNSLVTNLKMYHLMIQYLKENVDDDVFERSKEYADDYFNTIDVEVSELNEDDDYENYAE
tara:strand:+ start:108 stop:305 length:198 start_codon:yes stop_codon:yes gene_type:complete